MSEPITYYKAVCPKCHTHLGNFEFKSLADAHEECCGCEIQDYKSLAVNLAKSQFIPGRLPNHPQECNARGGA